MDWTSISLLLIVILLALLILIIKNQTHTKVIVFLIILCNVGVVLLNNKEETFVDYTDILNRIKSFQSQSSTLMEVAQDSKTDANSKTEILTKVDDLNKNVKNLEELLNTAIGMDQLNISKKKINFQTSDKVLNDIELYKQLQLSKLAELQNQLSKTQQIVSSKENASETNKYKPIKIYSSCIVGNADGTYST